MALSVEKQIELEEAIEACLEHSDVLTPWERKFMSDISERYEERGDNLFLSARQWHFIEKASRKITGGPSE